MHGVEQPQLADNDALNAEIPMPLNQQRQLAASDGVDVNRAQMLAVPMHGVQQPQNDAVVVSDVNPNAAFRSAIKKNKQKRKKIDDCNARIWPEGTFKGKQMRK